MTKASSYRKFADETFKQPDFILGLIIGAGVGVWAALRHDFLTEETGLVDAAVGGAIGLLAVTLAAMTLILGFLQGIYKRLIQISGRPQDFFRPFLTVAVLSGAAAVAGFISALSLGEHSVTLASALFGTAIFLLVWAVVGAVQLVFILADHGVIWLQLDEAVKKGELPMSGEQVSAALAKTSSSLDKISTAPEQEEDLFRFTVVQVQSALTVLASATGAPYPNQHPRASNVSELQVLTSWPDPIIGETLVREYHGLSSGGQWALAYAASDLLDSLITGEPEFNPPLANDDELVRAGLAVIGKDHDGDDTVVLTAHGREMARLTLAGDPKPPYVAGFSILSVEELKAQRRRMEEDARARGTIGEPDPE